MVALLVVRTVALVDVVPEVEAAVLANKNILLGNTS